MSAEARCGTCGHPDSHHDAGECWTNSAGDEIWGGDDQCPCSWWTPAVATRGDSSE